MSYIEHKTLVITGEGEHLKNAYKKAKNLFAFDDDGNKVDLVSKIIGTGTNGYKSFFISPTGSKNGWEMDIYFEYKYKKIVEYLNSKDCKFEDGSSCIQWVLVEFGDTGSRVKNTNCENKL